MRWYRIVLYALVCVVLVLGAGVVFLLTIDPTDYKTQIEQFVERQTGRSLVIDGQIDLNLGMQSGLTVTEVSFGNPDWAADETMAKIRRLAVVVDIASLWSGPLTIELLEIETAELHLESLPDGKNNWTFTTSEKPASDNSDDTPLALVLKQIYVSDFDLTVRAPVFTEPFDLTVISLAQSEQADGLFNAHLKGKLNERSILVSGKYGPLDSLLTGKDLHVDVNGQFDTLTVLLNAMVDDLSGPRRPQVDLKLQAPDVDEVTSMLSLRELGDGKLDVELTLLPNTQSDGNDDLLLTVNGIIGRSRIDAQGTLSDINDFERVDLDLKANGPDLKKIGTTFGQNNFPPGPFNLSGSVSRNGPRLTFDKVALDLGEANLQLDGELTQFPQINGAMLTLVLKGAEIGHFTRLFELPDKARGPFTVNGQLQVDAQGLEQVDLTVDTQQLKLKIDGELQPGTGITGATARISGRSDELAMLSELLEFPLATSDSLVFSGNVKITEDTVILPEPLNVTLGENRITVTGTIGFDPLGDRTRLGYQINGPDLDKALSLFAVDAGLPVLAYTAAGNLTTSKEGIRVSDVKARIGDNDVNVAGLISLREGLDGTRLDIAVKGPKPGQLYPGPAPEWMPDSPFTVQGTFGLSADAVALDDVKFTLGDVKGNVTAAVGLPLAKLNVSYSANVSGDSLRTLLPAAGPFQPAELPFQLNSRGSLDDFNLRIEKSIFKFGAAQVSASGTFDLPPDLSQTNLQVTADIEDISTLGLLNGEALPKRELRLNATFSGSPESFSIKALSIKSNGSDLTGSIVVDLQHDKPDVRVALKSNLLVLPGFDTFESSTEQGENSGVAETRKIKKTRKEKKDERIIPDLVLPVAQLQRVNAVVDIDIREFQQFPWRIQDLTLDVKLNNGRLEVEELSGKTANGSIKADLVVEPFENTVKVTGKFQGENILPGGSMGRTLEEMGNAPKFKVYIAVDGAGNDLRTIAANLNGGLQVSSTSGHAPNTSLRFLYGNALQEIYSAINPFSKTDEYTEISCIMLVADIHDGIIDARPGMAIQTDKINIGSVGTIDLATEKIDINFKTAPRSKVSISAGEFINPYIKVSGTMANPGLTLDPTSTIVSGGAAVATAGLSLLAKALWDRVMASSDPCGEVVKQAEANANKNKNSGLQRFFNRR